MTESKFSLRHKSYAVAVSNHNCRSGPLYQIDLAKRPRTQQSAHKKTRALAEEVTHTAISAATGDMRNYTYTTMEAWRGVFADRDRLSRLMEYGLRLFPNHSSTDRAMTVRIIFHGNKDCVRRPLCD